MLLAAPDTSVVLSALHALVAFVRKTHSSSTRLQASAGINTRLLALCQGWGGKEQVPNLLPPSTFWPGGHQYYLQ